MGKAKAHQKYFTKDGILVPGVTTVLQILNKPFLLVWANKIGLEGIKMSAYVDNLADIGTLAHSIVEAHLKKTEVDYSDYTPNQKILAENSAAKFFDWEIKNKFEVIKCELQMVSDKYFFGGTVDIYCILNGKKTLIDLKTSKSVYPEHFIQTAAYKILLEENGYPVEECRILRIGRSPEEGFEEVIVPNIEIYGRKFLKCVDIIQIDNELKLNRVDKPQ